MFEKLKTFRQRMAIYGLIVILGLPLSLFAGSIKPAQASEKPKAVTVQKTSVPEPAKTPAAPKMAFIGQPTGLHRANTYVAGQSISMQVSLSDDPVSVWAEVGALDPNFPENLNFSAEGQSAVSGQNQGQGKWNLKTPKLSSDLNIGEFSIKISAQALNGKTVQTQVKITLEHFTAVTVLSYKVSAAGTANIDWSPVSWADAYLVNWQIQGDDSSNKFETTKAHIITLENLESGTFYEVRIQPLRGDAAGPATKVFFKTLGLAPIKEVAGEFQVTVAPKTITPSIDGEAATTKKVAEVPQVTPKTTPKEEVATPTPTPTPSPSEEGKAKTGGWSKILIALSILIIAAGAAIGGYYGYEWLMLKSKDKEPPEKDSSNRW